MIQDQGLDIVHAPQVGRGTTGGSAQTIFCAQGPGWHVYDGGFHMLPKRMAHSIDDFCSVNFDVAMQ